MQAESVGFGTFNLADLSESYLFYIISNDDEGYIGIPVARSRLNPGKPFLPCFTLQFCKTVRCKIILLCKKDIFMGIDICNMGSAGKEVLL